MPWSTETNRLWPGTRVLWQGRENGTQHEARVTNGYWDDTRLYYITIGGVTYASAMRYQLTALAPFANE